MYACLLTIISCKSCDFLQEKEYWTSVIDTSLNEQLKKKAYKEAIMFFIPTDDPSNAWSSTNSDRVELIISSDEIKSISSKYIAKILIGS